MQNFQFYNPAKILFGKGEEAKVGSEIKAHGGTRVLVHYGGGSVKKSGLLDRVFASLKEAGLYYVELGGAVPNPRLGLCLEGIELCRKDKLDFVLAIGGGSSIDSAKCIAAGAVYDGDIWDYYMDGTKTIPAALPVATVLTIPAAGSESSPASVITKERPEGDLKRYVNASVLIPKFSILNPELTFTLPAYQTACGASDILAHLMERYFCPTKNVDLTDRLIEACAKTIINFTPIALRSPEDYNARAEMMWCGVIAHNNLLNMGREDDWATHNIEHELSGVYDIAHGAGLAILFPAWMKYVHKAHPQRFVQFARRFFDVEMADEQSENAILEGIARLERFYKSIGMPVRLSEAGIDATHFRRMADTCVLGRGSIGSFRRLSADDIFEIYKLAK